MSYMKLPGGVLVEVYDHPVRQSTTCIGCRYWHRNNGARGAGTFCRLRLPSAHPVQPCIVYSRRPVPAENELLTVGRLR